MLALSLSREKQPFVIIFTGILLKTQIVKLYQMLEYAKDTFSIRIINLFYDAS